MFTIKIEDEERGGGRKGRGMKRGVGGGKGRGTQDKFKPTTSSDGEDVHTCEEKGGEGEIRNKER